MIIGAGAAGLSAAEAIRNAAAQATGVVVIGAGLAGLDAVYALLDIKKNVTVIETAPQILPFILDEKSAKSYQELFEVAGCKFRLGRKVSATDENAFGYITKVTLDDGSEEACDLVIAATGVRPAKYSDSFADKKTINYFGLLTMSVGAKEPVDGDTVVVRENVRYYKKLILRDKCVIGVISQGDISGSSFWQHLVKNKVKIDSINKHIWKLSFADFCNPDENGEYLLAV